MREDFSKFNPAVSKTLSVDPSSFSENWKQEIQGKEGIPVENRRLTFPRHFTDGATVFHDSISSWNDGEDLVKDLKTWKAIIRNEDQTIAKLHNPKVLAQSQMNESFLNSKSATAFRSMGVNCNLFFLAYEKWGPNSKLPKNDKTESNVMYIPLDDKFRNQKLRIDLFGIINGVYLNLPLTYALDGSEFFSLVSTKMQMAQYRKNHQIRRSMEMKNSSAQTLNCQNLHGYNFIKSFHLDSENEILEKNFENGHEILVSYCKGLEIHAVVNVVDSPSWLKCLILTVITVPFDFKYSLPRQLSFLKPNSKPDPSFKSKTSSALLPVQSVNKCLLNLEASSDIKHSLKTHMHDTTILKNNSSVKNVSDEKFMNETSLANSQAPASIVRKGLNRIETKPMDRVCTRTIKKKRKDPFVLIPGKGRISKKKQCKASSISSFSRSSTSYNCLNCVSCGCSFKLKMNDDSISPSVDRDNLQPTIFDILYCKSCLSDHSSEFDSNFYPKKFKPQESKYQRKFSDKNHKFSYFSEIFRGTEKNSVSMRRQMNKLQSSSSKHILNLDRQSKSSQSQASPTGGKSLERQKCGETNSTNGKSNDRRTNSNDSKSHRTERNERSYTSNGMDGSGNYGFGSSSNGGYGDDDGDDDNGEGNKDNKKNGIPVGNCLNNYRNYSSLLENKNDDSEENYFRENIELETESEVKNTDTYVNDLKNVAKNSYIQEGKYNETLKIISFGIRKNPENCTSILSHSSISDSPSLISTLSCPNSETPSFPVLSSSPFPSYSFPSSVHNSSPSYSSTSFNPSSYSSFSSASSFPTFSSCCSPTEPPTSNSHHKSFLAGINPQRKNVDKENSSMEYSNEMLENAKSDLEKHHSMSNSDPDPLSGLNNEQFECDTSSSSSVHETSSFFDSKPFSSDEKSNMLTSAKGNISEAGNKKTKKKNKWKSRQESSRSFDDEHQHYTPAASSNDNTDALKKSNTVPSKTNRFSNYYQTNHTKNPNVSKFTHDNWKSYRIKSTNNSSNNSNNTLHGSQTPEKNADAEGHSSKYPRSRSIGSVNGGRKEFRSNSFRKEPTYTWKESSSMDDRPLPTSQENDSPPKKSSYISPSSTSHSTITTTSTATANTTSAVTSTFNSSTSLATSSTNFKQRSSSNTLKQIQKRSSYFPSSSLSERQYNAKNGFKESLYSNPNAFRPNLESKECTVCDKMQNILHSVKLAANILNSVTDKFISRFPLPEIEHVIRAFSPFLLKFSHENLSLETSRLVSSSAALNDSDTWFFSKDMISSVDFDSSYTLNDVWRWYEEPSTYGLGFETFDSRAFMEEYEQTEVQSMDKTNAKSSPRPNAQAFYIPYLSAIQLFRADPSFPPSLSHSSSESSTIHPKHSHNLGNQAIGGEGGKREVFGPDNLKPSHQDIIIENGIKFHEDENKFVDENEGDFDANSKLFMHDKYILGHLDITGERCQGENHILFEFAETLQPQLRMPLFTKLRAFENNLGNATDQLTNEMWRKMRINQIHPASWFSVAWYPVYRIPDAPLRAVFLTFHSFGAISPVMKSPKLPPSASLPSSTNNHDFIFPVIGLQWYNAQGEHWFDRIRKPSISNLETWNGFLDEDPELEHVMHDRINSLQRVAASMASASPSVISSSFRHSDYEFMCSRHG